MSLVNLVKCFTKVEPWKDTIFSINFFNRVWKQNQPGIQHSLWNTTDLECCHNERDDCDPDSDPEPEREELQLLALGEVPQGLVEKKDGTGHTWKG